MKVISLEVSPRYLHHGLRISLELDSPTLDEMEILELLKGDVVGSASAEVVDHRDGSGFLVIHIFPK